MPQKPSKPKSKTYLKIGLVILLWVLTLYLQPIIALLVVVLGSFGVAVYFLGRTLIEVIGSHRGGPQ
ncbi:hypothetical protein ACET53_20300 [Aeromonas veronii]|jgi:hypothetical protein